MAKKSGKTKRAALRKVAAPKHVIELVTITLPKLEKDEKYKGLILDEHGKPVHHVILLPGELEGAGHDDCLAWAKKQGGYLPEPAEGFLLLAQNSDGAFKKAWYWLAPKHASHPDFAWVQNFGNGTQICSHQSSGGNRARAVRRVAI